MPDPARFGQKLRSVGSGGETLGDELLDWGRAAFGCAINEFYGQTECNLVVSNCASILPVRPGSMGRAVPGHEVAVVDADGQPVPPGTPGTLAVRRPDPVMFLGYWNNPEATAAKFAGDWLLTGDQGVQDEDGYFRFVGREDDVITSAGYRIGPGEIEDCLLRHPAVSMAAVVGVPDALRTERVGRRGGARGRRRAGRSAGAGDPGFRPHPPRRAFLSAGGAFRREPADDRDRQGDAPRNPQ